MGRPSLRLVLGLAVAAAGLAHAWQRAGSAPPGPLDGTLPEPAKDAPELRRMADALGTRLAALVAEAERYPEDRELDIYFAYTPEEMKNRRKAVDAKEIVGWMSEERFELPFRKRCAAMIVHGQRNNDVDLGNTRSGRSTVRAAFYKRHVAPLLRDSDPVNRQLARELLEGTYPLGRNDPDIAGYKVEDKGTWTKAYAAWGKLLDDS